MNEGVKCRHGTFVFPPEDHYIGKALEIYGEYSEQEVQFICSFLKTGDTVIEVGAHIGAITVPMANAVEDTVHAFEPQEAIRSLLLDNVINNNLHDVVRVYDCALGMKDDRLFYSMNPRNTGGVELKARGDFATRVETLDSYEFREVDFIKIDVEGMELEVLVGARATLIKCRPVIYLENDRPLNTHVVLNELFGLGYRVWRHEPWLFNPDNFRKVPHNPYPGIAALNLVAVPAEKEAPPQCKGLTEILPNQWAAVCRFGGIGDNLIAAAVFSGLVRQGNKVEVITNEHCGIVFENNPYVSKLSICKDGDQPKDGGKEWQSWFEKRSHEYKGGLFHLSHSVECSLAFVQAQTQFWWRPEMRRIIADVSYLEMAATICGSGHDFYPLYYPTGIEMAKARETKAKVGARAVGWILCGSRFDKVYPYAAYAIARIIKELGVPVIMFGDGNPEKKDHEIAKVIQHDVEKQNGSTRGLHLAMSAVESADGPKADWPIRRSLAQLLQCDLVISPDTGSAWACAMEPMPKIMLLSHASANNIIKHWVNTVGLHADPARVPCWPCHRLHDVVDTCVIAKDKSGVACMADISVEAIVQKAKEALNGNRH